MKIKKGDNCIVISGNEKGKTGKVLKVFSSGKVLMEGINLKSKHIRAKNRNEKSQVAKLPIPINISNVMILESGKRVRIGAKIIGDKKIRISKKTGKEI